MQSQGAQREMRGAYEIRAADNIALMAIDNRERMMSCCSSLVGRFRGRLYV